MCPEGTALRTGIDEVDDGVLMRDVQVGQPGSTLESCVKIGPRDVRLKSHAFPQSIVIEKKRTGVNLPSIGTSAYPSFWLG